MIFARIACWLLIFATTAHGLEFSGHSKWQLMALEKPLRSDELFLVFMAPVRINSQGTVLDRMRWTLGYEVVPTKILQDSVGTGSVLAGPEHRWRDLNQVPVQRGGFLLQQNLDRLHIAVELPWADLILGRQAITFGKTLFAPPADVFTPYGLLAIDDEYRRGIDAVRLRVPIGALSELDLGVVANSQRQAHESSYFLRWATSLGEVDSEIIAMRFLQAHLLSAGFALPVGDLGASMDMAQVWPGGEKPYFRAGLALDALWSSELRFSAGGYYNGAGRHSKQAYGFLTDDFAYRRGGVYLLGVHYVRLAVHYSLTPLLQLGLQELGNLDDGSHLLAITLEYSLSENWYLNLSGNWGTSLPHYETAEFERTPGILAARLRFYW